MTNILPFGDLFDEIENDAATIQKYQGPLQMFLRQELRRLTMKKSFFKRAAAPHFFSQWCQVSNIPLLKMKQISGINTPSQVDS